MTHGFEDLIINDLIINNLIIDDSMSLIFQLFWGSLIVKQASKKNLICRKLSHQKFRELKGLQVSPGFKRKCLNLISYSNRKPQGEKKRWCLPSFLFAFTSWSL